ATDRLAAVAAAAAIALGAWVTHSVAAVSMPDTARDRACGSQLDDLLRATPPEATVFVLDDARVCWWEVFVHEAARGGARAPTFLVRDALRVIRASDYAVLPMPTAAALDPRRGDRALRLVDGEPYESLDLTPRLPQRDFDALAPLEAPAVTLERWFRPFGELRREEGRPVLKTASSARDMLRTGTMDLSTAAVHGATVEVEMGPCEGASCGAVTLTLDWEPMDRDADPEVYAPLRRISWTAEPPSKGRAPRRVRFATPEEEGMPLLWYLDGRVRRIGLEAEGRGVPVRLEGVRLMGAPPPGRLRPEEESP
ncbi:MAG: hypothetical protein K8I02_05285, partial [Candidatus Methylomirabilis sp.]|nr:hypothetical protein [Deltaproteobacteria bacterium]